jgi:hypothetical protein
MFKQIVSVLSASMITAGLVLVGTTPAQAAPNKRFVCTNSSWGRIEFTTAPSQSVKYGTYVHVVIVDKANNVNIAWLAAHTPNLRSSHAQESSYIALGINSRLNQSRSKVKLFVSGCRLGN